MADGVQKTVTVKQLSGKPPTEYKSGKGDPMKGWLVKDQDDRIVQLCLPAAQDGPKEGDQIEGTEYPPREGTSYPPSFYPKRKGGGGGGRGFGKSPEQLKQEAELARETRVSIERQVAAKLAVDLILAGSCSLEVVEQLTNRLAAAIKGQS
jgi:hypothetical protein